MNDVRLQMLPSALIDPAVPVLDSSGPDSPSVARVACGRSARRRSPEPKPPLVGWIFKQQGC